MSSHIPAQLGRQVRRRAGDRCEYCGLPQQWQEAVFHIDHVKPQSRGGKTTLDNLALACVSCSLRKAARVAAKDRQSGKMVQLFNPRRDTWHEHFKVGPSMRIRGLTTIGRVTVSALAMNRSAIVAIRQELAAMAREES